MNVFKSFKEESRFNYGKTCEVKENISGDKIQLGAILRIADAVELMAKNHQQLIEGRDQYRRWYKENSENIRKLNKRISDIKGYITKLKRKKVTK